MTAVNYHGIFITFDPSVNKNDIIWRGQAS